MTCLLQRACVHRQAPCLASLGPSSSSLSQPLLPVLGLSSQVARLLCVQPIRCAMFVRRWLAGPMLFGGLMMTLAKPPASARVEAGSPPVDKKVGGEVKEGKATSAADTSPS